MQGCAACSVYARGWGFTVSGLGFRVGRRVQSLGFMVRVTRYQ